MNNVSVRILAIRLKAISERLKNERLSECERKLMEYTLDRAKNIIRLHSKGRTSPISKLEAIRMPEEMVAKILIMTGNKSQ